MGIRKYARVTVPAKAFISFKGSLHVARVTDVSAGGILVEIKDYIPVGSETEVVVSAKGVSATFVGEVIRQTESGLALRIRPRVAGVNPLSKILMAAA